MKAPLTLRSGGQTGVDRAALDFALERGIPYGGWCPRGGRAEDIPEPPGLLRRYPQLTETPSAQPEQRTAWNVRDSHATLILTCGNAASPGTEWTRTCAKSIFLKPCCVVDLADEAEPARAAAWLRAVRDSVGEGLILNVAGPRESEAPGIYGEARGFLERLLPGGVHSSSPLPSGERGRG